MMSQPTQTHKESSRKESSLPKLTAGLGAIPERDPPSPNSGEGQQMSTSPDSLGTTRGCRKGSSPLKLTGGS